MGSRDSWIEVEFPPAGTLFVAWPTSVFWPSAAGFPASSGPPIEAGDRELVIFTGDVNPKIKNDVRVITRGGIMWADFHRLTRVR